MFGNSGNCHNTLYLPNTKGPSETTEKVGVQDANLQNSMRILGLCPKNEVYSEIFGIMGGNISLHYPFFYPIIATIRFRFTAIAVNIACKSTLFRPYPVARSNP